MPNTGFPCSSGGTNGSGGAVTTAQPVATSSGAASAQSRQARKTSGARSIGNMVSPARTVGPSGCRRKLELGDDAEVPAAAADAPEQVGVILLAGPHDAAVREHDFGGDEVVAGQAVLGGCPAVAAAGGEAAQPGRGDTPAGSVQPVCLGGGVELAPPHAAAGPRGPCVRVHGDRPEAAQVDLHPVVAGAEPGEAVAAAADRHHELPFAGGVHGGHDIRGGCAAGDHRRVAVDHRVEDPARLVVAGLSWFQHLARELLAQRICRIGGAHRSPFGRSATEHHHDPGSVPRALPGSAPRTPAPRGAAPPRAPV